MGLLKNIVQKVVSSPIVQKVVSAPVVTQVASGIRNSPVGVIASSVTASGRGATTSAPTASAAVPLVRSSAPSSVGSAITSILTKLPQKEYDQVLQETPPSEDLQKAIIGGDVGINVGGAQQTGTNPIMWIILIIIGFIMLKKR